jgi:dTDP-4-dehydrorhamnose 3,5-epimerase
MQENHSFSERKGTIRGLHFQFPPYAETKLVRCIAGEVFDVCVDLRKDSSTFGTWEAVEISEKNKKMVLIPRGCAHGMCTLRDRSEVLYKVDNWYEPRAEGGILWNDATLNIPWPTKTPVLSKKDAQLPTFHEFIKKYKNIDVNRKYV